MEEIRKKIIDEIVALKLQPKQTPKNKLKIQKLQQRLNELKD